MSRFAEVIVGTVALAVWVVLVLSAGFVGMLSGFVLLPVAFWMLATPKQRRKAGRTW